MSTSPVRSAALDALRAGAAALVLLSHARTLAVRDAVGGGAASWPEAAFLAVSGLGHQAVIVFFALSGFVITEAMMRLHAAGRWSLGRFAVARLARLWVVLAPCLILGVLLDRLGLALADPGRPYGLPPLAHAPVGPSLDLGTALGNLIFLQTVAVPVLGSNGPLWSLANEFWYYGVAALGFAAWRGRRYPAKALLPAAGAVLLLGLLPWSIVSLAPVWSAGAIVAVLRRHAMPPGWARRLLGGCGTGTATVLLLIVRLHRGPGPLAADLGLGLAVAAVLLGLPTPRRSVPGHAAAWTRRGADLSYSLYLSHLPVLSLTAALAGSPDRLPVGPRALLCVGLELVAALAVATGLWWLFERHTGRVQAWLATRSFWDRAAAASPSEVAP